MADAFKRVSAKFICKCFLATAMLAFMIAFAFMLDSITINRTTVTWHASVSKNMSRIRSAGNYHHDHDHMPDVIIMGSTNGGTSTLNRLLNDLRAFYTYPNKQSIDLRYWTPCTIDENGTIRVRDGVRNTHRFRVMCDMNEYVELLGMNEMGNASAVYHWERSSDYNRYSAAMRILSAKFASTKLLLTVRESLTQTMSRIKNFQCSNSNTRSRYTTHCVNKVFKLRKSATFRNEELLHLLQETQTHAVREQIVSLFNQQVIFEPENRDICPYINILVMLNDLDLNNAVFGHSRFRIMQFESMVSNLHQMAKNIYCFVLDDESQRFEQCIRGIVFNATNLDNYQQWTDSEKTNKGRQPKYKWLLSDQAAFEAMDQFHDICDLRLQELVQQYNASFVLGDFDFRKWKELRSMVRQSVQQNVNV